MAETKQDSPGDDRNDALRDIAKEVRSLTAAFAEDSRRHRMRFYFIMIVAGIGILAAGGNVWRLVEAMNDDMESMSDDMALMKVYMASMHTDMGEMSEVMDTMDTMGADVRRMTASVDKMAVNVDTMSRSVGVLSTMTPAVHKMSADTGSMTRDMHWMMPFNWVPFQ